MFKKTMTFDDLDGNEVTQTFYFNYNKKEIAELLEFKQLEEKIKMLQTPTSESGLTQVENNQMAYDIFQDLILDAYGEKGEDNVTFKKTPELREYWKSHVAFVEMIFEFLENPQLGGQFIENCLPTKLVARAKEEIAAENQGKISSDTLSEMVAEANRRQEGRDMAIQPGETSLLEKTPSPDAPPVEKSSGELTAEDVRAMDEEEFNKLDVRKLNREAMIAAFGRKSGS